MSHYWLNLKNALLDINPSTYRGGHALFGLGKKYKANQADLDQPFEEGYIESSDVYAITNKIARAAKTPPWKLEIHSDGDVELITKGILFDLIHQPNKFQSREDYAEQALLNLLIGGNNYLYPIIPTGFKTPSESSWLHPQLIEIITTREGKMIVPEGYKYRIDGEEFSIVPEQITHMKYTNPSRFGIISLYGLSPLVAGYLTVKGLVNNQTASTAIYDNHGVEGILSNESGDILTPEEQEVQQDLLDSKLGGADKLGQVLQSSVPFKYTRLGLDPTTMKLVEGKVLTMRDLANIYDVQSTLFNDPTNRIQNNIEPSGSMFWTNAVIPNNDRILATYNKGIVTPFNQQDFPRGDKKYVVSVDYSRIEALQRDKKSEAEKDKLIMEGIQIILGWPISIDGKKIAIKENYDVSDEFVDSIVESIPENNL